MADETTTPETYEVPGMHRNSVIFCVDRLFEGYHEGGRLAVAVEATAPETYEVPGMHGSAVNFCVDRLIEGRHKGGDWHGI